MIGVYNPDEDILQYINYYLLVQYVIAQTTD